VLLERLRDGYKFEVNTRPPRIAYRETITGRRGPPPPQEADRRRGPVRRGLPAHRAAAARRRLRVRRPGQGRHHPYQFIPAVEKGVREVLAPARIAGYPVVDVRVIVYDGKHHSVDSKEIAFVTAGRKAFMAAIREARPSCWSRSCTPRSPRRLRHGRHHGRPVGPAGRRVT
jgi:elongation factor G